MSSVDRLSNLPDDALCRILSFLTTKESVSTSVLGRRWRSLWSHVSNFDFFFDDDTETNKSYVIHTVLSRHKAKNIVTFRLNIITNEYEPSLDYPIEDQLEKWITTVIERNVLIIDLDILCTLPRCLFTCQTVVDMSLELYRGFTACEGIYLPSLKKLSLWYLGYEDDQTLIL